MSRIPGGREVERALKSTARAVTAAVKAVNLHASKLLARGDYAGAEAMVNIGRAVSEYQKEIEGLRGRWRTMNASGEPGEGEPFESTPLWEYYRPILRAIESLGGEAKRREIEQRVEPELTALLKPGDKKTMARGQPRWKVMVRRARKYLIREGFLEDIRGPMWRITSAGRRTAREAVQADRES